MIDKVTKDKINVELIKVLFRQYGFILIGEILAVIGVYLALSGAVNHNKLIQWALYMLAGSLSARALLLLMYYQTAPEKRYAENNIKKWYACFALGILSAGIGWGICFSFLMPKHDLIRQTFLVFILYGGTAATNIFYSPFKSIYAFFLVPVFAFYTGWLMNQESIMAILGLLSIVYVMVMLTVSYFYHQSLYDLLLFRFDNEKLIEHLSNTKSNLEIKQRDLERSLSLIRTTLDSTTNGLLVIDENGLIEDYNHHFLEMFLVKNDEIKAKPVSVFFNFYSSKLTDDQFNFSNLSQRNELKMKNGTVIEYVAHPRKVHDMNKGYVISFENITDKKTKENKLLQQAYYDALTGLPNRILLNDRINQAIALHKKNKLFLAFLFIDVDKFKEVNDELGHAVGDEVLKIIAKRLVESVKESDTVSRKGGDEFFILVNSLHSEREMISIANRIIETVLKPIIIETNRIQLSVSLGISFYPRDGEDVEKNMLNADVAMYQAKQLGGNQFQFFTKTMNDAAHNRKNIEEKLKSAIQFNDFCLYYQPIVDLKTQKILEVETFLHWDHIINEEISTVELIHIAEECGLIEDLTQWIWRNAISQMKEWRDKGFLDIKLSINLTSRQFKMDQFVEKLQMILSEYNLDANCISFELSEAVLMESFASNVKRLTELKALDVEIILDDFGTGHSNLTHLKKSPIDKIKIDREFMARIPESQDAMDVASAVISLAKHLQYRVIAEGVENIAQVNFLIFQGCDQAQGYFFARPMSAEDCTKELAKTVLVKEGI